MEPARTALAKYESAEAVDRGKHIGFVGVSEEVVISELSNAKKSPQEIRSRTRALWRFYAADVELNMMRSTKYNQRIVRRNLVNVRSW
ncbi:MAG: hypothetical protein GX872_07745 [Firmicutes bacterium]|nr:hypothetical protein [Bacillota bacterium]